MRNRWTYTRFMPTSAPRTEGVQESELCTSGSQAFASCALDELRSMGLTEDKVMELFHAPLAVQAASTEAGFPPSSFPQA